MKKTKIKRYYSNGYSDSFKSSPYYYDTVIELGDDLEIHNIKNTKYNIVIKDKNYNINNYKTYCNFLIYGNSTEFPSDIYYDYKFINGAWEKYYLGPYFDENGNMCYQDNVINSKFKINEKYDLTGILRCSYINNSLTITVTSIPDDLEEIIVLIPSGNNEYTVKTISRDVMSVVFDVDGELVDVYYLPIIK